MPSLVGSEMCIRDSSNRWASAAAVPVSLRRDTTLPACSYVFTIGKFRRWWYSGPPCSTFGGWRLFPTGPPLCPALECWSSSQPAPREQRPVPISSPMKLHRSLLFASSRDSRVFVSPVQPALFPGSPRTDGFHRLDYRSHRVGNKAECPKEQTHRLGSQLSIPHITPIARNDTKLSYLKRPNEHACLPACLLASSLARWLACSLARWPADSLPLLACDCCSSLRV